MKSDVKTLIAALTTERNAIDRAIAGLKLMSEVRDGGETREQPTRRPRHRNDHSRKPVLTDAQKSEVGAMLLAALERGDSLGPIARQLARRFGGSPSTIMGQWRVWTKLNQANRSEPQPDTNASAIGVQ